MMFVLGSIDFFWLLGARIGAWNDMGFVLGSIHFLWLLRARINAWNDMIFVLGNFEFFWLRARIRMGLQYSPTWALWPAEQRPPP